MSNTTALFQQWEGKIVSRDFSGVFVFVSYLVSWVGAWTTLELLNRWTARRGLYNWFLLIGSSISMGGIAIWCMHYIGNRAIKLGDGSAIFQISYNPGFTALSFFVPIIVLLITFTAVGSGVNEQVSVVRVILGGTLTGLAICGMHYLGQASISNYTCIYQVPYVVGAALIAIVVSILALYVFFVLRASWTNSVIKRLGTAVILAGGVSGMHWTASVGTQYRLKDIDDQASATLGTSQTVIVVIVLSVAACLMLVVLNFFAQRRRARSANRAQQVVLAAATFDMDGKLMVTPEGYLPSQKITNTYLERSFNDVFAVTHPIFMWLFRTSRNWKAISPLLPGMRDHIHQIISIQGSRPGTKHRELRLTDEKGEPVEDYSIIFQELFCVAAGDLAARFNEPVENLGVLYDDILSTGQIAKPRKGSIFRKSPQSSVDLERDGISLPPLGRGQLLFVVRQVERRESDNLQAAGFRFASVQKNVVNILAHSMQINSDDLEQRIRQMSDYASRKNTLEPGVHLACFAARATVRGGFDVLVRKDARDQLPTSKIVEGGLEHWHLQVFNQLNGQTVSSGLNNLARMSSQSTSSKEQAFASQVLEALKSLATYINDSAFQEAVFVSEPIAVPCRTNGDDTKARFAHVFVCRLLVPVHMRALGSNFEFVPMAFFRLEQRLYENSPDHAKFARVVHREFGDILSQAQNSKLRERRGFKASLNLPFTKSRDDRSTSDMTYNSETPTSVATRPSDEKFSFTNLWNRNKVEGEAVPPPSGRRSETSSEKNLVDNRSYGGILVSQEISVDVNSDTIDKESPDGSSTKVSTWEMEMNNLGAKGQARYESPDTYSYVDTLLSLVVPRTSSS